MKRKIYVLVLPVLAVLFSFSGFMLLRSTYQSEKEKQANLLLAQAVKQEREAQKQEFRQVSPEVLEEKEKTDANNSSVRELPILPEYKELWEQNKDLAGWLTIADLGIDYAVMYTPNAPEYYLHRGFDGEEALSGSLFIGEGWVDGVIYFDGRSWHRMDPTFASANVGSSEIMAYIGDGSNYSKKYQY